VITERSDPDWIEALRPANNTGEICTFYHALKWTRDSDGTSAAPVAGI